jgi:hypothetical protein
VPSPFEICLTLAPPEVLGRRLAPFSLGHAHLLEISKSPFIAGSDRVDSADLILAVWICSFPHYGKAKAAALAALAGRVPRSVRRWGKEIGLAFSLKGEAAHLAYYIGQCTKPPRMARKDGAKSLSTPTAATLAVLHRHYFHTLEKDVWDLPFLDAMLDVITYHHAQGWVDVISDKQAEFIDAVKGKKAKP